MKRNMILAMALLVVTALALAACGGGGETTEAKQRPAPPAEYASLTNPFEGDASAAEAGKATYEQNCLSCHGEKGLGDGPAGASLDPKPGNLPDAVKEGSAYVHWVTTKGGTGAGLSSSMPAWEGILTDDQIWQVVTYVETWK